MVGLCLDDGQDWERMYTIIKARQLTDASRDAAALRCCWRPPTYLEVRCEQGSQLPTVEVGVGDDDDSAGAAAAGGGGGASQEGSPVVGYVVKDMDGDLFVELMDLMGQG